MKKKFRDPIYVTRPVMPDLNQYVDGLKEIWESQWLSNSGKQLELLENQLKDFLNVDHISLFNNGTTALTIAIQALRLQGEVITTPFSFPATTHALAWNGITPVFCDIDNQSMTIDARKIERLITNKTSAILGVHVYGIPCDTQAIQEIADKHGLKVIYDAAHAFGTQIDGTPIGSFGDITMFSFHPTKLFHSAEGGALVFRDGHIKQRLELLKNFGIKNEDEVILPGINGKMNELSALMGRCVLPLVAEERASREKLRKIYQRELSGIEGVTLPSYAENIENSQQYFVIRIEKSDFGVDRNAVYNELKNYNIFSRKYFSPLISEYPCYRQLPSSANLPIATKITEEVLCLPFYGELGDEDVYSICAIIRQFAR